MLKIAHLSDIHVKKDRINEYRVVFQNLYKDLKEEKVNIIVVCGDIFNDKIITCGEEMELVSEFLESLSEIGKLIIIEGNHDVDIKNDESTGLLDFVERNKKFIENKACFFKKSGVYEESGIIFGVVGAHLRKDNENIRKMLSFNDENKNTKCKIVLFHEDINGAKYHNGKLISAKLTSNDFNEFDIAMGGHIHLYQHINSPKCQVAYCGSLVQQNFGESTENHGYLLWKIDNCDSTRRDITYQFKSINNPYQYVKLYYSLNDEKNNLKNLQYDTNMIKKCQLICNIPKSTSNLNQEFLNFKKQIEDKHKNKLTKIVFSGEKQNECKSVIKQDNISIDQSINLIKDILHQNKNYNDDVLINKVIDLHNKFYTTKYVQRNMIDLIQVEFSDVFCFGKNNYVNFSTMENTISGVISNNESGKTSFMNIILYSLFGSLTSMNVNDVIARGKHYGYTHIIFRIDVYEYRIERRIGIHSNNPICNIYKTHKSSKETTLITDNAKEANVIIEDLIGNFESIKSSSFFKQSVNTLFTATPNKRTELLTSMLNLDIYTSIYDKIEREVRDINAEIKSISKEIPGGIEYNRKDLEKKIKIVDELNTKIKLIEEQLVNKTINNDQIKSRIKNIENSLLLIKRDIDDFEHKYDLSECKIFDNSDEDCGSIDDINQIQKKITEIEKIENDKDHDKKMLDAEILQKESKIEILLQQKSREEKIREEIDNENGELENSKNKHIMLINAEKKELKVIEKTFKGKLKQNDLSRKKNIISVSNSLSKLNDDRKSKILNSANLQKESKIKILLQQKSREEKIREEINNENAELENSKNKNRMLINAKEKELKTVIKELHLNKTKKQKLFSKSSNASSSTLNDLIEDSKNHKRQILNSAILQKESKIELFLQQKSQKEKDLDIVIVENSKIENKINEYNLIIDNKQKELSVIEKFLKCRPKLKTPMPIDKNLYDKLKELNSVCIDENSFKIFNSLTEISHAECEKCLGMHRLYDEQLELRREIKILSQKIKDEEEKQNQKNIKAETEFNNNTNKRNLILEQISSYKNLLSTLFSENKVDNENNITEIKNNIADVDNSIAILKKDIKKIMNVNVNVEVDVDVDVDVRDKIILIDSELKSVIEKRQKQFDAEKVAEESALQSEYDNINNKKELILEQITSFKNLLTVKEKDKSVIEDNIKKIDANILSLNSEIKDADLTKLLLESDELLKSEIEKEHRKINDNATLEEKMIQLEYTNQTKIIQDKILLSENVVSKEKKDIVFIEHKIKKLDDMIAEINIAELRNTSAVMLEEIQNIKKMKTMYEQQFKLWIYKKYNKLCCEYAKLKNVKDDLDGKFINVDEVELSKNRSDLIKLECGIEHLNKIIAEEEKRLEVYAELSNKKNVYEAYKLITGPKGITAKLLNNKVKLLEMYVNDILNSCSNTKIRFYIIVETNELSKTTYNLKFDYNDSNLLDIGSASSFRLMAISLSLHIALWKINDGPILNAIFLDETLSPCDAENLHSMTELITNMCDDCKNCNGNYAPKIIFVISHDPYVKKLIDEMACLRINSVGKEKFIHFGEKISYESKNDVKVEDKTDDDKIEDKTKNKFYCKSCDTALSTEGSYRRHLLTKKHLDKVKK